MSDFPRFLALLEGIASPDNQTRNRAEAAYSAALAQTPGLALQHLVQTLCTLESAAARTLAAVLLRRATLPTSGTVAAVDPGVRASIRSHLADLFRRETVPHISRKVAHCIASLAAAAPSEWPDVAAFALAAAAPTEPAAARANGLFLLNRLCECVSHLMLPHRQRVGEVLAAALADADTAIRVHAFEGCVSLLLALDQQERRVMQPMLDPMVDTLLTALQRGEEELACRGLEALVEVARISPTFLQPALDRVGSAMVQIASSSDLDSAPRRLGIEFLLTLSEAAPSVMRKHPSVVQAAVPLALHLISEVEDDPAWPHGTYADLEFDEDDAEQIGISAMGRLSDALGGAAILPVAFSSIPQFAADADWRKRFAAMMAVSELGAGSAKLMRKEMPRIVDMVLRLLGDAHPRVRFAAVHCLGRLAEDFKGKFQPKHHAQVVPALVSLLRNGAECERVRGHAISAVCSFADEDNCPASALTPYLQPLLEALFATLQQGPRVLQEEALSAVSSLAAVTGAEFLRFYDVFMPPLKTLLREATSSEMQTLRGRAMQCIGLIAESVGRDRFVHDAREIMDALMATQQSIGRDDPQAECLVEACVHVCKCMGADFVPYMRFLLPPLIASLGRGVELSVSDAEEEEVARGAQHEQGVSTTFVALRGVGIKKFSMNTDSVEEKRMACVHIGEFAESLGPAFAPFVTEVGPKVLEHVGFKYYEGVRSAASLAVPQLLGALVQAGKQSGDTRGAVSFLEAALAALAGQLGEETQPEARACVAEGIALCLKQLAESGGQDRRGMPTEPALKLPLVACPKMVKALLDALRSSLERRAEAVERTRARLGELSEEEAAEILEDALDLEEELTTQLVDAHGYLLKMHKADFLPVFDRMCASTFAPLLAQEHVPGIRLAAVCAFDDVVEHCGLGARKHVPMCLRALLANASDEHLVLRQASVYGLGQVAERAPDLFAPVAAEAVSKLMAIIQREDARDEDNETVTDNAISAMLKIMRNLPAAAPASKALPMWLSWLPLRGDEIEAKLVHDQLCDMVEGNELGVAGEDGAHAPEVLRTFAQVLQGGAGGGEEALELATPQTKDRIRQLARQMVSRYGTGVVAGLGAHQQELLLGGAPSQ